MSWQDEFNALTYAEQYRIREMATIFGVPVSAAYMRTKELNLLPKEPEHKENSSFVLVPEKGTVVPELVAYMSRNGTFVSIAYYDDLMPASKERWTPVYTIAPAPVGSGQ